MRYPQEAVDYHKISKALQYLGDNFTEQPSLKDVADAVHLSEYHFQKLFSRWVGISPKRFLQYLTKEYSKQRLKSSESILNSAFDAGLSGPGRLHDLMVQCDGVTPGEYKAMGEGLEIVWGIHDTPFGRCLLAQTTRGVCNLQFLEETDTTTDYEAWLAEHWPSADIARSDEETVRLAQDVFAGAASGGSASLHLFLKGTNFQMKVWEALLQIPSAQLVSYQQVAQLIGKPKAVRAVASAIAANPIGYIIPCHRVIRKMGVIHQYRWGAARKRAIIGWEAARQEQAIAG